MGTVGDRAFNDNDEITFLGSRVPRQTAKFTCQKRRDCLSPSRDPHGEYDPKQSPRRKLVPEDPIRSLINWEENGPGEAAGQEDSRQRPLSTGALAGLSGHMGPVPAESPHAETSRVPWHET